MRHSVRPAGGRAPAGSAPRRPARRRPGADGGISTPEQRRRAALGQPLAPVRQPRARRTGSREPRRLLRSGRCRCRAARSSPSRPVPSRGAPPLTALEPDQVVGDQIGARSRAGAASRADLPAPGVAPQQDTAAAPGRRRAVAGGWSAGRIRRHAAGARRPAAAAGRRRPQAPARVRSRAQTSGSRSSRAIRASALSCTALASSGARSRKTRSTGASSSASYSTASPGGRRSRSAGRAAGTRACGMAMPSPIPVVPSFSRWLKSRQDQPPDPGRWPLRPSPRGPGTAAACCRCAAQQHPVAGSGTSSIIDHRRVSQGTRRARADRLHRSRPSCRPTTRSSPERLGAPPLAPRRRSPATRDIWRRCGAPAPRRAS